MTIEMLIGGFFVLVMVAGIVVSMTSTRSGKSDTIDWGDAGRMSRRPDRKL